MKTELEILKEVLFSFELQSDFSTNCNGYRALRDKVVELEMAKPPTQDNSLLISMLESQLKIEKVKAEVYYWSGTSDVGLHGASKEAIKEIERQIAELKK